MRLSHWGRASMIPAEKRSPLRGTFLVESRNTGFGNSVASGRLCVPGGPLGLPFLSGPLVRLLPHPHGAHSHDQSFIVPFRHCHSCHVHFSGKSRTEVESQWCSGRDLSTNSLFAVVASRYVFVAGFFFHWGISLVELGKNPL